MDRRGAVGGPVVSEALGELLAVLGSMWPLLVVVGVPIGLALAGEAVARAVARGEGEL